MLLVSLLGTSRLLRTEVGSGRVPLWRRIKTVADTVWTPRRLAGATRLHLGCGDHLLDGWTNVDLVSIPGVVPWNLATPLPIQDRSVDLIFSEHFLEHVPLSAGASFLRECHRVLKPGARIRISTPDLQTLVREYQMNRTAEWADVGWLPETPCRMMNEGMRLWGHEFVYDAAELTAQLAAAGFSDVVRVEWHRSSQPDLCNLERRLDHGDLIMEATR